MHIETKADSSPASGTVKNKKKPQSLLRFLIGVYVFVRKNRIPTKMVKLVTD